MQTRHLAGIALSAWTLTGAALAGDYQATGAASWYGERHHGKRTASGERFDMNRATAAHPTLPMGSMLEVTNLANNKTVLVRVNDRGPYSGGRIIDLSKSAAQQLDFISRGTARVRVRAVDREDAPADEPNAPDVAPVLRRGPVEYTALEGALEQPPLPTRVLPAEGGFAVQAGTFSVKANAERAAKLVGAAGATEIRTVELRGATFHVVVVGAWGDRSEAENARAHVASVGFGDARVVSAF